MFDRRYVYLMIRTKENEARIIVCRKMLNARKVERRLHRTFGDSRFIMTKKIRYRKWFQNHIKIGIAKNPVQRKNQVSKNIFKSGRTEWFAINDFELLLLHLHLWWNAVRLKAYLLTFVIIIFLIIQITGIESWKELFF